MTLPNPKPGLGMGRKIGAVPAPTPLRPVELEEPALFVAAPVKPVAAPKPAAVTFAAPALGGAAADLPLLGVYPGGMPSGDTAEQSYKLSGTSRDVAKNAYPFEDLAVGQPLFLVSDPYGATVKQTKVSMPGDSVGHPDPTAVSVMDAITTNGRHVGYIPAAAAKALSFVFGEHPNTRVWATVEVINRDRDNVARGVGIKVVFGEGTAA